MSYELRIECNNTQCKRHIVLCNVPTSSSIPELRLPKDWRIVQVDFGNQGGKAEGHACSFQCAVLWHQQQLKTTIENAEYVGPDPYKDLDEALGKYHG